MELTEAMEAAGFAAIEEYERWKAERKFPRPSLIAHIWDRMTVAIEVGDGPSPHCLTEDAEMCADCDCWKLTRANTP